MMPGKFGRKLLAAAVVGAVAIVSFSTKESLVAFVAGAARLQSSRGAVALQAYGDLDREEWLTYPKVQGERTWQPTSELMNDENRAWFVFDADGKSLGHLASAIAETLKGKSSPLITARTDVGAFCIVVNCDKIRVTGKAWSKKLYFRNTFRIPGKTIAERFRDLWKRFPERIIMKAVWGMLAVTRVNKRIFKERLKLYTGPNHAYHDKEPILYPMWKIKSVGPHHELRRSDRLETRMNQGRIRYNEKKAKKEAKMNELKLSRFKEILKNQIVLSGQDAQSMSLPELTKKAERTAILQRLEEFGPPEKPMPKTPPAKYLGTRIVKRRVRVFNRKAPPSIVPPP